MGGGLTRAGMICDRFWEPIWYCPVGPELKKEAKIREAGCY